MRKPIQGMKNTPFGEDYMVGAWLGLLIYTSSKIDHWGKVQFKKETNIDIDKILSAKGINTIIDEVTGYQREAVVKWADWVTKNIWGSEEDQPGGNKNTPFKYIVKGDHPTFRRIDRRCLSIEEANDVADGLRAIGYEIKIESLEEK